MQMSVFKVCLFLVLGGHVSCITIPQGWVQILEVTCHSVESDSDVLGPPLVRDVCTFTSLTKFLQVNKGQVCCI